LFSCLNGGLLELTALSSREQVNIFKLLCFTPE